MKVERRGLTIELAEDDPRVAIIDLLLFGPALPRPATSEPSPPPEPQTPFDAFWKDLRPSARDWLERLSEGPVVRSDAGKIPALRGQGLLRIHQHIGAVARRTGVPFFIAARGRDPKRRWFIPDEYAQRVRAVATGKERVRE